MESGYKGTNKMITGIVLSIIGSLCPIFAQGTALLIIGRIIQGLSAACIMPAIISLVKAYYEGAERQRAMSFWSIGSWGGSGVCSFAGVAISAAVYSSITAIRGVEMGASLGILTNVLFAVLAFIFIIDRKYIKH